MTNIVWKGTGNEEEKHFEITFTPEVSETTPSPIKARELLLMTGNGSYLKPTEANGIKVPKGWEQDRRIMDMDQLMRFLATSGEKGKRICIQGGNAAIDAVEQAIRYGHEVHWLVRSGVNILANSLLVHAPKLAKSGSSVNQTVTSQFKKGVSLAEVESTGGTTLRVKAYSLEDEKTGRGESEVVTKKKTLVTDIGDVHYYVYCIGQEVKPLTNYQIQSVADVRQLAALKDVMRAYCNTLSGASLDPKNVNFLGGTKNEIAAFIAMHHEFIPPVVADELTHFLMRVRTREEFTNGYTGEEVTSIRDALKGIDDYFKTRDEVRTFLEKKMTQVVMDYRKLMLAPFQAEISTLKWTDILRED